MWFRNLVVYRLPAGWSTDADDFEKNLQQHPLKPCGGFDMESRGFTSPQDDGAFLCRHQRQWLMSLGVEQKLLPRSIVRQQAKDRAEKIAQRQGHPVGRKQLRDITDKVASELLPRALARRRTTWGWLDGASGWLAVDAAADAGAEQFLEALRGAGEKIPSVRLEAQRSPAAAMADWLVKGDAPGAFGIDQDLELRSPDATKATVRYARHNLDGREIRDHLKAGKTVVRLGLTWNDRISFVLTEHLQFRRLAFLDVLRRESDEAVEDEGERFEADFALMTGELSKLLADMVKALGGSKQRVKDEG